MFAFFRREDFNVGKFTYMGSQKIIERFVMVFFSVYAATMMIITEKYIGFAIMTGLVICWLLNTSKYRTFEFRAVVTSVVMQLSVVLYGMQLESISPVLSVFIVFTLVLGLYGMETIIGLSVISSVILFCYHAWVVRSIPLGNITQVMNLISQIVNLLIVQYVVYIWTKRNREGSEQLMETIEELQEVERTKDDFVANVSHEIRTPINTICGMSDLIMRQDLPYETKENVLSIQMASENLMAVVSDILDFSELQAEQIELEEEAYHITTTINDVVNHTLARRGDKKIEIIVDCDANIPSVLLGDEKKLRRVIIKLVDNAIKFTDEGFVSIAVSARKESYGVNLSVSVKDSGIGISEEGLEKVFTSFSQINTSSNRQEGGLGLGLAISNALVQKMGGAITVNSKPGKGTTVQFVVPQKVLEETPVAAVNQKENINAAVYIDMEQFDMVAIRDEYIKAVTHIMEQLKVDYLACRNLAELQRREKKENFSHVFINMTGYRQNPSYFEELAKKTKVIIIMDHKDEKEIKSQEFIKIYKPLYVLKITSVLNGLQDKSREEYQSGNEKFTTQDAHVLVVDDNRMNLRVVKEMLKIYNIKVTTAISGKDALEKIISEDYDFVFMDHMMPEMDGVETFHRIRNNVGAYYKKVPIVALTANAVAGAREMMLKEGFNDFLAKPIERSVLERVLKRNLPPNKIIYEDYEEETEAVIEEKDEFVIEGLDVQQGIVYCNGKEQYIKILQGYCEDWNDAGATTQEAFEKEDWKNYTIAVHGLKSAMRSIGALAVSEKARKLEMAGKEGRIDYILEHHRELMKAYEELFAQLRKNELLCPGGSVQKQRNKKHSDLPELEEEVLDCKIAEMEEAMYAWNGELLMEIIGELKKYQYGDYVLSEVLAPVERKVEMSDYMSAVETVKRWKDGLTDKE